MQTWRECYENLFDFNHIRHWTDIRGKTVFITLLFNNENAENQIAPYLHLDGYLCLLCTGLAKYKPNISEIQSCEWVCDLHRSNSANISPMMSGEFCHWPTNLTSLQIASLDFCLGRGCFLRICHWLTGWESYWHQGESGDWERFWEIFHFVWENTSICVKDKKNISDLHNGWAYLIFVTGTTGGACVKIFCQV